MQRRTFLKSLTALVGGLVIPAAGDAAPKPAVIESEKLLQISRLAGFQFYAGAKLWPELAVGQPLTLHREADNRFDANAVRVDWNGHKLGYVPREENTTLAQLLDRGERLTASISRLTESSDPWQRMQIEVRLVLS